MSLENIKSTMFFELEQIFAEAAADEAAGFTRAYNKKLGVIATIAELLGMKTKFTQITLDLMAPVDSEDDSDN